MWDERNELDSLLWESAVDDMGIYPRATIRDGVETPRTERQEGWNEAVMAITERHEQFTAWTRTLSDEQRKQLAEVLDDDNQVVYLHWRDGRARLSVLCGDTFCYACSDAEIFTVEEFPEIYRLLKTHGLGSQGHTPQPYATLSPWRTLGQRVRHAGKVNPMTDQRPR